MHCLRLNRVGILMILIFFLLYFTSCVPITVGRRFDVVSASQIKQGLSKQAVISVLGQPFQQIVLNLNVGTDSTNLEYRRALKHRCGSFPQFFIYTFSSGSEFNHGSCCVLRSFLKRWYHRASWLVSP